MDLGADSRWLGLRPKTWALIGASVGVVGLGALGIRAVLRRHKRPQIKDGVITSMPDDGDTAHGPDNLPRWPLWSTVHEVQIEIDAPGWYTDVLTSPDDSFPCGAKSLADSLAKQDKHGQYFDCHDLTGLGDPQPLPFQIRLGPLEGPQIVRALVEIVDTDGVTNATRWRTSKDTSGRKNGEIDVNEYWFEGPRDETCYREVLARRFDGLIESPYTTRHPEPCAPATDPQAYTLYRAQREVAPTGWLGQVREWYAKIQDGTPYPLRSAIPSGKSYVAQYNLGLDVDAQGAFISGTIAPSLPPLPLRVSVQWATRPG